MADGELLPVSFQIATPGDDFSVLSQMASADVRYLPEAAPLKSVTMVASGPSAAQDGRLWAQLRKHPETVSVALNGALGLFLKRGLKPTYWCACDPQRDQVLAFLPDEPPEGVIYLLASKVHPDVFERLKGRDVRIWRIDDHHRFDGKLFAPCAVSVTLVAQSLFRFMGFHRFEMHGWDCCYLGDKHHASDQQAPLAEHNCKLEIQDGGSKFFDTTGSWMAELNDAAIQTHNLVTMGYEVAVHGPGAVGAVLRAKRLL